MNLKKDWPTVPFYGISLYSGTIQLLIEKCHFFLEEKLKSDGGMWTIYTPNPEQMVLAWEDSSFLAVLKRADILLPDGAGLVWAVRRSRSEQPTANSIQRITGREVFHDLLGLAKELHLKVFLLGGKKGAGKKVMEKWKMENGQWGYDDGLKEQENEVLEKIRAYKPDLLFVAYGAPHQEMWVDRNREALKSVGVKIAMVVGGAFEYEAGLVPRVLPLVEKLHVEWLQRLILEPWRWQRQLKGLQFFLRVLLTPNL